MQTIQKIDNELKIESSFEMLGLVGQLKCTNYLMPLFESIVNSIQSIQLGNIKNGIIEIHINRSSEQGQLDLGDGVNYKIQPISDIIIQDNGLGFNNKNLKSFLRAYSTDKIALGCKGIGRFSWLKAFDNVKVESIFEEENNLYERTFSYNLPNGIDPKSYFIKNINESSKLNTIIKLIGLKNHYSNDSKQKIETIARKILEHCFYYISADNAPIITISGHDNEQKDKEIKKICINSIYKELYSKNITKENIKIKQENFDIKHIKLFDTGEETGHKVYFCGNNRTVLNDKVKNITKLTNLEDKIQDIDSNKKFYYISYVSGNYLDKNTDEERTGFKIPEKEETLNFDNIISLSEIKKAIAPNLINYIAPYLESVQKTKMETIGNIITNELPEYKYLLNEDESFFDDITPSISPKELKTTIRNKHFEKKEILTEKFNEIIDKNINDIQSDSEYHVKLDNLTKQINDIGRADLAVYVAHRKIILEYFQKYLSWNDTAEKYFTEDFIHNLIYPMRSTSDDIPYEEHNLWLIDDRLSFSDFIASDKPFSSLKNLDSKSGKEADLTFFNHKNLFSTNKDDLIYDSITIVEFKRPERTNYSDTEKKDENPINQIYNYIDDIKNSKAKTPEKRTVGVNEHTRFYGYVICDITDKIKTFAEKNGFLKTPDGNGYYAYNPSYNSYIEVISFNKVLIDCRKRNDVLFRKLGLK